MSWIDNVVQKLSNHFDKTLKLENYSGVGGGSINESFHLETDGGDFFVKKNSAARFPEMFEKEAKGLEILKTPNVIRVPEVVMCFEELPDAFLVLNYIHSALKKTDFWEDFAQRLARLHQNSTELFGLDHDNYIGSLYQSNTQHDNWAEFFRAERLEPQLRMARDSHRLGSDTVRAFERFYNRLDSIFPQEPPALIHGDFWGGNFMVGEDGAAVVIDPAVYYGHREMDLGMSQLFGGFDGSFYAAYHNYFPLEPGWQERLELCNLYPLLVHVNLFGGGYTGSVRNIISRF